MVYLWSAISQIIGIQTSLLGTPEINVGIKDGFIRSGMGSQLSKGVGHTAAAKEFESPFTTDSICHCHPYVVFRGAGLQEYLLKVLVRNHISSAGRDPPGTTQGQLACCFREFQVITDQQSCRTESKIDDQRLITGGKPVGFLMEQVYLAIDAR